MSNSEKTEMTPRRIKPLDPQLVNRIAAGEIIQRPFNALKELMENSLDAGSTSISVQIKEGGLKLIQIQDNGCGIDKEDLNIVCERFTTSKLKQFEDLKEINTFGFRGEALASISHVSRLTIISRTPNSQCAYKATYTAGKLNQDGIKPCASASKGTQIIVEDLFYNSSIRKNALRNVSEEFQKIYEVVSRYAIHNYNVSFFLKRIGENSMDLKTVGCLSQTNKDRCEENETILLDTIGLVYGNELKKELQRISIKYDENLKFEMNGYISNSKYTQLRQMVFILFINERLVDCQPIKKAINSVFTLYMPKNTNYFVYMNLKINPKNLDVNIHPTKHEVRFLHEDNIINQIQTCVEKKLLSLSTSRECCAKNLTMDSFVNISTAKVGLEDSLIMNSSKMASNDTTQKIIYQHKMTRVDSKERKIDSFLNISREKEPSPSPSPSVPNSKTQEKTNTERKLSTSINYSKLSSFYEKDMLKSPLRNQNLTRTFNFNSLTELKAKIEKDASKNALKIFQDMSYVGNVNWEMSLIQYQTELFLTNTKKLLEELFYQICVFNFGNFGCFRLENPISLNQMAMIALEHPRTEWTPEDGPKDKLSKRCAKFLYSKSKMIDDYFSIKITKQISESSSSSSDQEYYLETLPILLENYVPDLSELPLFIIRLATEVDWKDEKECFDTLSRQLAIFYSTRNNTNSNSLTDLLSQINESQSQTSSLKSTNKSNQEWIIEHVIYAAFRNILLVPKEYEKDIFFKLVDLSKLYRVFERC